MNAPSKTYMNKTNIIFFGSDRGGEVHNTGIIIVLPYSISDKEPIIQNTYSYYNKLIFILKSI